MEEHFVVSSADFGPRITTLVLDRKEYNWSIHDARNSEGAHVVAASCRSRC